jgi:hypothetical protein
MKILTVVAAILAACGMGCSRQPAAPSVSTEGLPPMEAIKVQLSALKETKGVAVLNVQEIDGEAIVQVTFGESWTGLNIAYYPTQERPEKALGTAGITVPSSWEEKEFQPGVVLMYHMPPEETVKLPAFINDLFLKFFKRSPDYKVDCYIETF